jgi:hypothetical protein
LFGFLLLIGLIANFYFTTPPGCSPIAPSTDTGIGFRIDGFVFLEGALSVVQRLRFG